MPRERLIGGVLLFGWLRGIPPFWQLIDMSFGVFGIVPLWWARRLIRQGQPANTRGAMTGYQAKRSMG